MLPKRRSAWHHWPLTRIACQGETKEMGMLKEGAELLRAEAVAARIDVSTATLKRYREDPTMAFPAPAQTRPVLRWRLRDVDAWAAGDQNRA